MAYTRGEELVEWSEPLALDTNKTELVSSLYYQDVEESEALLCCPLTSDPSLT